MKFRITLTMDVDMPDEKNEDMAKVAFSGAIVGAISPTIAPNIFKDFHFISVKAQKIMRLGEKGIV